jgi:molecular chaperone GrpE
MVNDHNEKHEEDLEITNEDSAPADLEIEEMEEKTGGKLKQLRDKVSRLEEEKKQLQDELQRAKAEFLNARRRLDEERERDRVRSRMKHIEELLPLCDSFQMAMSDKEAWEKAEPAWRKGVEGIHTQLMSLLQSYGVRGIHPETGEAFDPHKHEAIGTEEVDNPKLEDTVVTVVQRGYEMQQGDSTEMIRHARVTTGTLKESA